MANQDSLIVIGDLRGGRNGFDPPMALPANQCVEALNVDWFDATLARKRGGADAVDQTGGTAFTVGIEALARYVPGADETAAQLWAIDGAATPIWKRLTGGVAWADVTPKTAIASRPQDFTTATLNGKLYTAYDSTVDRLHVWDGTAHRLAGVGTPAAPTVANSAGAGTYAATARTYKIAYTVQASGVTLRRSELGAAVSFTPDGSHLNATVTKPATISEGETHWELYGAAATGDLSYYLLATTAVATATYLDTAAPAAYSSGTAVPLVGTNVAPTSAKYLLSDGNRLLALGAWETTGAKYSRVWYTPVLGTSDVGDDERVPNTTDQKNWIDLDENDGGFGTGLGGPLLGSIYAYKFRQTWKLVPTGVVSAPYKPIALSKVVGCIRHQTVVMAEDENGNPALWWLSHKGPMRVGVKGIEYCGWDTKDLWDTVNLGATTVVAHGVYHPDKYQIWWWIATGSANLPNKKIVVDTRLARSTEQGVRGGWSVHTGDSAAALSSCLFSNTLAASMSRDLKPHVGTLAASPKLLKCDTATAGADAGTNFQSYVKTRPIMPWGLGTNGEVGTPSVVGKESNAVTITLTEDRDFGLETKTSTCLLTKAASETRVQRKFEGAGFSGGGVYQYQIGDSAAAANAWSLDALVIPTDAEEAR